MPANAAPPLTIIVKLPYNRPEGAVNPQVVIWNAEKEAILWDNISRFRGSESAGVDWPKLSAHLQVPLPYLMYRAQVRYEEDLRGLQGTLGASVALPPPRSNPDTRQIDRRTDASTPRNTPISLRGAPSVPLSRQSTPLAIPRNKLTSPHRSPYGLQGSQLLFKNNPGGESSTATLQQKPPTVRPLSTSPLTARRPPSPPSPHSSSGSSDEDEEQREREENREQVGKQLKELEKMMSSQLLGFARPKGDPVKARERLTLSIMKETQRVETSNERVPSAGLIPSIPSPPPDWRSDAVRGAGNRGSTPTVPRAPRPPQSPPHQIVRNKMLGRHPTNERNSNEGSSASSFSDLSDASISTSALEDALTSNVKQGSTSRISTFTRGFSRAPG